jgi:hypothetical protein
VRTRRLLCLVRVHARARAVRQADAPACPRLNERDARVIQGVITAVTIPSLLLFDALPSRVLFFRIVVAGVVILSYLAIFLILSLRLLSNTTERDLNLGRLVISNHDIVLSNVQFLSYICFVILILGLRDLLVTFATRNTAVYVKLGVKLQRPDDIED